MVHKIKQNRERKDGHNVDLGKNSGEVHTIGMVVAPENWQKHIPLGL